MTNLPTIVDADRMTPGMARYWNAQRRNLAGRVDLIDPWRRSLRELRKIYGETHTTVYRASTGGRWGKSSQIVHL